MNAFEKIISQVPRESKVLDVGAFGLSGENTSMFLVDRFGKQNYTGICTKPEYEMEGVNLIKEDFYTYPFQEKFDVIVMDITIEQNLEDWSYERLEWLKSKLNSGGHLITYIMTTDQYGDPLYTPHLIRKHWLEWWGRPMFQRESIGAKLRELDDWELILAEAEDRRPYITWVLLKSR